MSTCCRNLTSWTKYDDYSSHLSLLLIRATQWLYEQVKELRLKREREWDKRLVHGLLVKTFFKIHIYKISHMSAKWLNDHASLYLFNITRKKNPWPQNGDNFNHEKKKKKKTLNRKCLRHKQYSRFCSNRRRRRKIATPTSRICSSGETKTEYIPWFDHF